MVDVVHSSQASGVQSSSEFIQSGNALNSSSLSADGSTASVSTLDGGANPQENVIADAASNTNPLAANSDPLASDKAVEEACGGGGCGGGSGGCGAQGDACTYMSQINAACQKAMTPYTDKCGSCGGSGVQGGGDGGGSGGGSGSGSGYPSTPEIYTLSYIFDKETEGLPAEGHIRFDSIANYPMTETTTTFNVAQWQLPAGTQPEWVVVTVPYIYMNVNFSTVTKVAISDIDMNGRDSSLVLDTLRSGSSLNIDKVSDRDYFVGFEVQNKYPMVDAKCTVLTVQFHTSDNEIKDGDIVTLVVSAVVVAGGVDYVACPDCGGTGLEGSTGGIPGLIMAVFNGSAGYAGATNFDIYGRKI